MLGTDIIDIVMLFLDCTDLEYHAKETLDLIYFVLIYDF